MKKVYEFRETAGRGQKRTGTDMADRKEFQRKQRHKPKKKSKKREKTTPKGGLTGGELLEGVGGLGRGHGRKKRRKKKGCNAFWRQKKQKVVQAEGGDEDIRGKFWGRGPKGKSDNKNPGGSRGGEKKLIGNANQAYYEGTKERPRSCGRKKYLNKGAGQEKRVCEVGRKSGKARKEGFRPRRKSP